MLLCFQSIDFHFVFCILFFALKFNQLKLVTDCNIFFHFSYTFESKDIYLHGIDFSILTYECMK